MIIPKKTGFQLSRRSFLTGLVAAPAIIAIERLMPVKALHVPPRIVLSNSTVSLDAANGSAIGELSMSTDEDGWIYSIVDDRDSIETVTIRAENPRLGALHQETFQIQLLTPNPRREGG